MVQQMPLEIQTSGVLTDIKAFALMTTQRSRKQDDPNKAHVTPVRQFTIRFTIRAITFRIDFPHKFRQTALPSVNRMDVKPFKPFC